MSKFKGYAQSSGFKTIQLPDTTRRIREEGARTTSRMERNFRVERENAQAVINALNDKYRIEADNRQLVFNLESENRERIRRTMVDNAEVQRQNNLTEQKQTQQLFDALGGLSETARKLSTEILEDRVEKGREQGAQIANAISLAGGSFADIEYIKDIDAAHIQNDERYREVVDRLRANGAPNDIVEQIRKANSSTLYGIQRTLLVNAGEDYAEELLRFETEQLVNEDGTLSDFTLGAARSMGGQFTAAVEAQDLRNRAEYIAQFQGKDNDPMVARYLYPKMVEAENRNNRAAAAERLQDTRREDAINYKEQFRTRYRDANGHASNLTFIALSANRRSARKAYLAELAEMAGAGVFGDYAQQIDMLDSLLDSDVSIDGQAPKKFRELFGDIDANEIQDISNAIQQRQAFVEGREAQIKEVALRQKEEEVLQWLHENRQAGRFDDGYSKQLIEELQTAHPGINLDRVKHYLTHNSSDAIQRSRLDSMLDEEVRLVRLTRAAWKV